MTGAARLRGVTVLAPSAGSGKTGISIGLSRVLADRGVDVEPFKAVAVVDMTDPAHHRLPPAQRGVHHNCAAARRPVRWWNNPVLVVADGEGTGELFVGGESAGGIPVVGEDSLDLRALPRRLRAQCRDAVHAGLDALRARDSWVIIEGGGAAGELSPDADLANHVAPVEAGLPVLLVGNPSRSGHMSALLGLPGLLAPELAGLVMGYVLNQVRNEAHAADVRARLAGRIDVPELAVLPVARQPPDYDGSPEILEWIYRRRANHVAESGLCDQLIRLTGQLATASERERSAILGGPSRR